MVSKILVLALIGVLQGHESHTKTSSEMVSETSQRIRYLGLV